MLCGSGDVLKRIQIATGNAQLRSAEKYVHIRTLFAHGRVQDPGNLYIGALIRIVVLEANGQ